MNRMEIARGARVRVRIMEEHDTDAVVAMRNQGAAARYLYQTEPLTADGHRAWLARAKEVGDVVCVTENEDGLVVGSSSLYNFDPPRKLAEYGRICAAQIGADPLTTLEASILIFRAAFEVAGLRKIEAHAAASNHRVLRHAENMGFLREGLLRQHWAHAEGYDDAVAFGCLRDEYPESHKEADARLYTDRPQPEFSDLHRENILAVFRPEGLA